MSKLSLDPDSPPQQLPILHKFLSLGRFTVFHSLIRYSACKFPIKEAHAGTHTPSPKPSNITRIRFSLFILSYGFPLLQHGEETASRWILPPRQTHTPLYVPQYVCVSTLPETKREEKVARSVVRFFLH